MHNEKWVNSANDTTFIYVYAPIRGSRYTKEILIDLKENIESNTMIVRDFNIPHNNRYIILDRKSIRKHWM